MSPEEELVRKFDKEDGATFIYKFNKGELVNKLEAIGASCIPS
jgi:hypothetical protein